MHKPPEPPFTNCHSCGGQRRSSATMPIKSSPIWFNTILFSLPIHPSLSLQLWSWYEYSLSMECVYISDFQFDSCKFIYRPPNSNSFSREWPVYAANVRNLAAGCKFTTIRHKRIYANCSACHKINSIKRLVVQLPFVADISLRIIFITKEGWLYFLQFSCKWLMMSICKYNKYTPLLFFNLSVIWVAVKIKYSSRLR